MVSLFRFLENNPYARPMVAFAWLNGPSAPIPLFIPISRRTGPFTTTMEAKELVELWSAVSLLPASARMTGRYAGLAPAITALAATFSTVYSQSSCVSVGRIRPTTSSGAGSFP